MHVEGYGEFYEIISEKDILTRSIMVTTMVECLGIDVTQKKHAKSPYNFDQVKQLESCFQEEYLDYNNNLNRFDKTLVEYANGWGSMYSSPSLALINGSMLGKSRLAMELHRNRFIIYTCFREVDSTGYPLRSCIADFVLNSHPNITHDHYASYQFWKFFILIGGSIVYLKRYISKSIESNVTNLSVLLSEWKGMQLGLDSAKNMGSTFWNSVLAAGLEIVGKYGDVSDTVRQMLGIPDSIVSMKLTEPDILIKLLQELYDVLEKLVGKDHTLCRDMGLVFVFDECRSLLKSDKGNQKTKFEYLRMVLSGMPRGPKSNTVKTMGVFIDTISKISNFNPSYFPDPSFRYTELKNLIPPYYHSNVYDMKYLKCYASSQHPISSSDDVKRFLLQSAESFVLKKLALDAMPDKIFELQMLYGRPAWSISFARGIDVVDLAMSKLLGGVPVASVQKISDEQYIAVLHCRLCLNVSAGSELAAHLTAYYCSTCLSVQNNNDEVYQLYCPDPVLFEAAGQLMYQQFFDMEKAIEALHLYIRRGLVDSGFPGELTAKLLVLLGMDHALRKKYPNMGMDASLHSKNVFTRFVTVQQFLSSTFDKVALEILNRQNDENNLNKLLEGKLFFNAFYYCTYVPDLKDLMVFFSKGLAVVCKSGQEEVDFIIPFYLQKLQKLSFILIQVKNIAGTDSAYKYASETLRPSQCGLFDYFEVPYLGIWMSLNYKNASIVDLRYTHNSPDLWPRAAKPQEVKRVSNQFLFGGFGIDESIYPCLNQFVDSAQPFRQPIKNGSKMGTLLQDLISNHRDILKIERKWKSFVDQSTYPMYPVRESSSIIDHSHVQEQQSSKQMSVKRSKRVSSGAPSIPKKLRSSKKRK
jgi:hypothetical protein